MFTALHQLAQHATLMIVMSAEADQLRVSVTPTQTGDASKAHKLRPLSLLGAPAELDADFAEALAVWQAPKRSLIEQAQDAVEDDDADGDGKPAAPGKAAAKPGRPRKAKAAPDAEPDTAGKESDAAPAAGPAAIVAAVDTLTLDLF